MIDQKETTFSLTNNFNLIRIFAAFQVALAHSGSHLGIKFPAGFEIMSLFPGVPIFFTVSGFLIANSFYRNPHWKEYFINRIVRIFPGLWFCFIVLLLGLFATRVLTVETLFSSYFWRWVICQVSFFQFYTPDFLRTWGVGTPNGSLWTIPVEIQFYAFLPGIYFVHKSLSKWNWQIFCTFLIVAVIGLNYFYQTLDPNLIFAKLYHITLAPFLAYFLFGYFSFIFWEHIRLWVEGKFLIWAVIYGVYIGIVYFKLDLYDGSYYPNVFGWISSIILSMLVLSAAFSNRALSDKILKGNDLSYGIYLYHMVVVNFIIDLKVTSNRLFLALSITFILAFISWKLVEKPCLRLKSTWKKVYLT
ncbi:acyltransferase [Cytophagaceae bacterium 50C-KIRBA]|uniref:Acyltransferase n=1 Tax=Aquirufa beregesia TaxID=2516556 RepID=A0ABX0ETW4_9BACT|nr:acyltransferase [Aquirufa beregesia]NGZ43804.1 acyltransferase [Aquirufa beregesia]